MFIAIKGDQQHWFRRHSSQVSGLDLPWVGASGLSGAVEIRIEPTLRKGELKKPPSASEEDESKSKKGKSASKKAKAEPPPPPPVLHLSHPPKPFTVRLHFAEPDGLGKGQRLFNVTLQGKEVLKDFDIAKTAGAPARTVMKEFRSIIIGDALTLKLTPSSPNTAPPVLNGVEFIAE